MRKRSTQATSQPSTQTIPAATLPASTSQPGDGQAELIHRAAIAWFDKALAEVDAMIPAAEAAADRLIAGGNFYVAGSGGFIDEMKGRAGGLAFIKEWDGRALGPNDVLLVGQLRPVEEGLRESWLTVLANGEMPHGQVVHVASGSWAVVKRMRPHVKRDRWGSRLCMIDTRAPAGGAWAEVSLGQMATCAMAWAFQGEMFAAGTRRGKTFATLASVCEPGGPEWNEQLGGSTFNDKFRAAATPAGKIGGDYLRICQRQAAAFLEEKQGPALRRSAGRIVKTTDGGSAGWLIFAGHVHPRGSIVPAEFTRMIRYGRDFEFNSRLLRRGDVLVYMGYLDWPAKILDDASDAGAEAVVFCVDAPPAGTKASHVRSGFARWDSCIDVKNYPVRILPTSGVVQTPQWYSLVGEMMALRK